MIGALSLRDLEFERRWIEGLSSAGKRITRLVRVGMPKIPQYVLDCVFFLYRDRDAAEAGRDPKGTGFLASMPSGAIRGVACPAHLYAISNWHVIRDAPVVGLRTTNGQRLVLDFDQAVDWHFTPGGHPHQGDDAAIAIVDLEDKLNVMSIPLGLFVTPQMIASYQIGVGEDVFMMGLFADLADKAHNPPKARFGNISMMPSDGAPIRQPNETSTKSSYVLDMHSRSGFSGSPVFFYRTVGADLDHANTTNMMLNKPALFGLLGLHWGQFPEEFKSKDEYDRQLTLEGMSGMSCAIPAWRLIDLFNVRELKDMRGKKEDEQRRDPKLRGAPRAEAISASAATPPPASTNPNHRADFNRLLGAAVKPPKSSG